MTIRDVSFPYAVAHLASVLNRGDTLHVIRRGPSRRRNLIVDVMKLPGEQLGPYVGALVGRPYLFTQQGILLKGDTAEQIVSRVSTELFGEPDQLKAVWL
jgi:hypothetical protein